MNNQAASKDVFLRPGEFCFAEAGTRIRTILGSCVAITLWHPKLRVGGMCHYMLGNPRPLNPARLDGRYAEDAVELFLREILQRHTQPREYQVKIFGGGNMFPALIKSQSENIGQRNMNLGQELLRDNGFQIQASHLGGNGYRRIIFDIGSGEVWVYHHLADDKQKSD